MLFMRDLQNLHSSHRTIRLVERNISNPAFPTKILGRKRSDSGRDSFLWIKSFPMSVVLRVTTLPC